MTTNDRLIGGLGALLAAALLALALLAFGGCGAEPSAVEERCAAEALRYDVCDPDEFARRCVRDNPTESFFVHCEHFLTCGDQGGCCTCWTER